ncbi:MAG: AAA family ATPase, partial [Lachnospiraceae bacterium]|nr:AAA family ATPase [Lachnospiraceae bacterium]
MKSPNKIESTPDSSVGADEERTPVLEYKEIIPEKVDEDNGRPGKCNRAAIVISDHLNTISMTELYDTTYPARAAIVDGFLYAGTYLFVGAPKIGKSFFMAQLAYCISTGNDLWDFNTHRGTVLYLALEDDYARLQRRLSDMFDVEENDKLHFATKAKMLSDGLDRQLENFIKEHNDVRLIIIDTLQKVREVTSDRFSYASDYQVVTKLKEFSDAHNICILVVHHTRKMESEDSFEMISGTNGLLGAADGAFVMVKKKRTDNSATISVVGRDQQDQELSVQFDVDHCIWKLVKLETEMWKPKPDPVLEQIA